MEKDKMMYTVEKMKEILYKSRTWKLAELYPEYDGSRGIWYENLYGESFDPNNWSLGYDLGRTDKDRPHNYLQNYEKVLSGCKKNPYVLEIGTWHGAGALFWRELLNPKLLCSIDYVWMMLPHIVDKLSYNTYPQDFIFLQADAYIEETSIIVNRMFPNGLDVISDDGSHWYTSQMSLISLYYPLLNPGGVMLIEDIQPNSDTHNPLDVVVEYVESTGYRYELFDNRHFGEYPISSVDDILIAIYKE
ncbi:MAG: hypothetical protein CMB80_00735 [Flammeovirgaceae bacterium]|nr:hypothetical protein [Flammeovirgaceae bacterium]